MIGCGAVALAKLILENEDIWPEEMSKLTNYCLNDLLPVLKHLNQTYKGAAHTQQAAIRSKYKSSRYIIFYIIKVFNIFLILFRLSKKI